MGKTVIISIVITAVAILAVEYAKAKSPELSKWL